MTQIAGQTALSVGAQIQTGKIDPRDLVEELLTDIATHDPDHLIYARTCDARARQEANAAYDRVRRGLPLSPLDGVPISWKDLFDSAYIETSGGSALLAGRVPSRDALALTRLTRAGTICLGKTNMTELAFSGLGINPVTGTPPNPFDKVTPRCPGGSSSGAAVSVARGLALAAFGSDTGGSIRLPAAWNGLVGLKPTFGIAPMAGVLPLAQSFDTIGPLTRDVRDAHALHALMMEKPVAHLAPATLGRCRFWLAGDPVDQGLSPDVARCYREATSQIERLGAHMHFMPWTEGAGSLDYGPTLVGAEAFAQWGTQIDANPQAMSMQLRSRFGSGRGVLAAQYLKAQAGLADLRARHIAKASGFDALIMPTCAITAPAIAPLTADPDLFASTNLLALRNTRLANLLGLPAITVPIGTDSNGMPIGLMLVGNPHSEGRLLSLALAIEQMIPASIPN
jgi:aspartyl-tRNA(Asn)/glutamyl-tRNA(Gln) amidotransferase subunit A